MARFAGRKKASFSHTARTRSGVTREQSEEVLGVELVFGRSGGVGEGRLEPGNRIAAERIAELISHRLR